jgi:hypothetical protein
MIQALGDRKSMNSNSKYSENELADMVLGPLNFIFAIFAFIYLVTFLGALFGGNLGDYISRYALSFAYLAGYFFLTRWHTKKMKEKIKLKNYQYLLIYLYFCFPIITIVPVPYNIITALILLAVAIKGIKARIKTWEDKSLVGDKAPNKPLQ